MKPLTRFEKDTVHIAAESIETGKAEFSCAALIYVDSSLILSDRYSSFYDKEWGTFWLGKENTESKKKHRVMLLLWFAHCAAEI